MDINYPLLLLLSTSSSSTIITIINIKVIVSMLISTLMFSFFGYSIPSLLLCSITVSFAVEPMVYLGMLIVYDHRLNTNANNKDSL